jgi:hypothetical protein
VQVIFPSSSLSSGSIVVIVADDNRYPGAKTFFVRRNLGVCRPEKLIFAGGNGRTMTKMMGMREEKEKTKKDDSFASS